MCVKPSSRRSETAARLVTYALAVAVVSVAALVAGLLDVVPGAATLLGVVAGLVPFDLRIPGTVAFVGLPLALALGLLARAAVTRTHVDVVLGAFAVPCLLTATWALYSYYFTTPGVYWGGLFTIVAGTLLALAVLADAAVVYALRAEVG